MKSKATLKGVGSGLAEMGTVIAAYTPADMPVFNYGNVTFNERDPWVGIRAMHDPSAQSPFAAWLPKLLPLREESRNIVLSLRLNMQFLHQVLYPYLLRFEML